MICFIGVYHYYLYLIFQKWNTINVTNINEIFSECSSLSLLPDISKWNINKVTDMRNMFSECSSLSLLPDISNWNTNNVDKG